MIYSKCLWNSCKWSKRKKGGFLSILLSTLGVNLLENLLAGKCVIRGSEGAIRVR